MSAVVEAPHALAAVVALPHLKLSRSMRSPPPQFQPPRRHCHARHCHASALADATHLRHHVCRRRMLANAVGPEYWRRLAAPLPRLPLPLRPPPPRAPYRRVHSRVYSDRVVAALVASVALATAPRSLLPRACLRQYAATLSIVVPPRQQFPCAHVATSGIIARPCALADAVAPPRLALSRHRVCSR